MATCLQRPRRRQHKKRRVRVNHRFAEPRRAEAEQITPNYQRKLQKNNHEDQPCRGTADCRIQAVDAVGKRGHMRKIHGANDGIKAGLLLIWQETITTTIITTMTIRSSRKP